MQPLGGKGLIIRIVEPDHFSKVTEFTHSLTIIHLRISSHGLWFCSYNQETFVPLQAMEVIQV